MKAHILFPLVLALASFGCAPPRYTYVPAATTTMTSADLEGTAATETSLGRGHVRLAALGVGSVTLPAGSGFPDQRVLFVRMDIENKSSDEWIIDEAEQRIEMTRRNETIFSYATTPTAARAPIVKVAASASAKLDLLFQLPPGIDDAAGLPSFDVVWTIHAGGRLVETRTPFERVRAEAPDRAPVSPPPRDWILPKRTPGTEPSAPPYDIPPPPWAPNDSRR